MSTSPGAKRGRSSLTTSLATTHSIYFRVSHLRSARCQHAFRLLSTERLSCAEQPTEVRFPARKSAARCPAPPARNPGMARTCASARSHPWPTAPPPELWTVNRGQARTPPAARCTMRKQKKRRGPGRTPSRGQRASRCGRAVRPSPQEQNQSLACCHAHSPLRRRRVAGSKSARRRAQSVVRG